MPPEPTDPPDDRQTPSSNGVGTEDSPEAMKTKLTALERQLGTLVNEKKRMADDRRQMLEQLERWKALGDVDPEQVKALLSQKDADELAKARESGEVDKLLADQRKKFEREKEADQAEIRKAKDLLEAVMIDRTLDEELERIKVKSALKKAAFAMHRPRVKMIADPDAPHGVRTVVEIGGDFMSVGDYLRQWAETDDDALEFLQSNQSIGGGAPGGRLAGGKGSFKRGAMTPKQKSDYIDRFGREAYQSLPWA